MNLVVGIGLRSGTPYRELRDLVASALDEAGGGTVRLVVTVVGRETEPGVQRLVASLNAELQTAPAEVLGRQPVPTPSEKVEELAVTLSVAEAGVLLTGAELVVPKRRSAAATVAIGRLPVAGAGPAKASRATTPAPGYAPAEREVVHRVISERRDVRRGFVREPIPDDVLVRVLEAAHRAPSVGLSQPWDFLLVRDVATRRKVHDLASVQRDAFAASLPPDRRQSFDGLKIEAILDTPLNIAVTCDAGRGGRHVLGRHADPRTTWFSVAIAIQNLWLAARAEGLGVGWVSFFEPAEVAAVLNLPAHIELVGYLCIGYVEAFAATPELVRTGWAARRPLAWAVHQEEWGQRGLPGVAPTSILDDAVQARQNAVQTNSQQLVRLIVGGDPAQYLEQPEALVVHMHSEKPAADFGVLWRPARTPVEAVELGVELARDLALQGVGEFDIQIVERSELADAMARGLRVGASACGVTTVE
ncbi:5,6-dimethylbenzimidazole synthase [Kribbella pittospori]|uniref:5,6-dimethylbenzimidazole synthase n=1 Tax=Kribbella pittospori TaxID=722689 RepID=A0A4V2MCA2_9ACTN|nr:5,6-dimethylbenzimidazole synthase [Kribbella pittospori]TCC66332.1 5,6-dimethylbenzimidazole synthase [Kribbella pittospori]